MPRRFCLVLTLALVYALSACDTGYNADLPDSDTDTVTVPPCEMTPSNTLASENARSVLSLVASLSCNSRDGVLVGQNAGYGNQVADDGHANSYQRLLAEFENGRPAVVAIDYEYDRIFTQAQLLEANQPLKTHWTDGGLVSVSWMPLNPWVNNALDPEGSPGAAGDTAYTGAVNLADLLIEGTEANIVWLRKLNAVAAALADLQTAGVAVLWRPLPEMNNDRFWWGTQAQGDRAELYTQLWVHMHQYFSQNHSLNNLLWVYSPGERFSDTKAVNWAYPGSQYVDVVAGMARDDSLRIADYNALNEVDTEKPLAMAEYGPTPAEQAGMHSADGTFDTTLYADRLLGSYSLIAYWVSWHSYDTAGSGRSHQAIVDGENAERLMNRSNVLTLEKVNSGSLR